MSESTPLGHDVQVANKNIDCLSFLASLIKSLNQSLDLDDEHKGKITAKALEQYGRIRIWSEESRAALPAASQSSLDSILRLDPSLQAIVIDIVIKIRRQAEHAIQYVRAYASSDSNLSLEENHWDSDESSDASLNDDRETLSKGQYDLYRKLKTVLRCISDDISNLFQVSMMIKRPEFNRRYLHSTSNTDFSPTIASYFEIDARYVADRLQEWKQATRTITNEDEPVATPEVLALRHPGEGADYEQELTRRLASANTRRREQLLYWSTHPDVPPKEFIVQSIRSHEEHSTGYATATNDTQEAMAQLEPTDHHHQGSKSTATKDTFTTVNVSDVFGVATSAGPARTIYTDTVTGSKKPNRVPDLPKDALEKDGFECPYCHAPLDSVMMQSRSQWKRHVFRDLRPYLCTSEICQNPNKQYLTRREWTYHERQMHYRQWICEEHRTTFSSAELFVNHVETSHTSSITQRQVASLVQISERAADDESIMDCPFCPEKRRLMLLHKHIAEHLESIALFVLPAPNAEEDEEKSDREDVATDVLKLEKLISPASLRKVDRLEIENPKLLRTPSIHRDIPPVVDAAQRQPAFEIGDEVKMRVTGLDFHTKVHSQPSPKPRGFLILLLVANRRILLSRWQYQLMDPQTKALSEQGKWYAESALRSSF